MALLQWVAVVLLALALVTALSLAILFIRRIVLQREGGFDMCIRMGSPDGWAGGWVFGIGRYDADDLEWYRTFSLSVRPKESLDRDSFEVRERRQPTSEEAFELPADHVILNCLINGDPADISMNDPATTAFLAWLEAAPPGGHLVA